MQRLRFAMLIALLVITALGGGLVVNAAFSSPAKVAAANTNITATNSSASQQDIDIEQTDTGENTNDTLSSPDTQVGPTDLFAKPGNGPFANGPEVRGIISTTENSGNTLVLRDKRIINLNNQTTVGDANSTLSASSLKAGDLIFALGTVQSDKSLLAKWVLRLPPPDQLKRGKAGTVNTQNNSFQLISANITWTVNISSDTKINKAGKAATLNDIATNDDVSVLGSVDASKQTIQAKNVQDGKFMIQSNFLTGAVNTIDVGTNSFVVTETTMIRPGQRQPGGQNSVPAAPTNGTQVKVTVDSSTKFQGQNLTGLKDLKPGDRLIVTGTKQTDGSFTAKTVSRLPANGRGGRGNPNGGSGNKPFNQFNGNNTNSGKQGI